MNGSYTVEKKTPGETRSPTRQRSSHSAVRYPSPPRSSRGARDPVPSHSERKERAAGEELRVPIIVVASTTPLPQAAGSTLQVERGTIAPSLPTYDPLLPHIVLVLQAAIEGESVAGQPSVQSLADAVVTPFLRWYGVTRQSPGEVIGGLSPYKLRWTELGSGRPRRSCIGSRVSSCCRGQAEGQKLQAKKEVVVSK
jgi:hypothetical protein